MRISPGHILLHSILECELNVSYGNSGRFALVSAAAAAAGPATLQGVMAISRPAGSRAPSCILTLVAILW